MEIKTRQHLIKAFLDFFKSKNHKIISNASLIPKEDPTVLFTTAGMHPLVPYLLGQKHPLGKKLCNVQKCIRTGDIEEVGDEFHLTFFEMLGNWSLGAYWKKDAISYSLEFLTKILKIPKEKLEITCFKGDKDAPKDDEAGRIWENLGIKKAQIKFLGKDENWWDPAGKTGPCGPDTEMFYKGFEIWNDVFMQYNKTSGGKYAELKQKNVDTGMGVERTIAVLNGKKSVYEIPCFLPIIQKIEKISKKKYGQEKEETKAMRIIADHIKASVFILAEGIQPGNKEHGYVLRRLIRRAVRFGKNIGVQDNFTKELALEAIKIYPDYEHVQKNKKFILEEIEKEEANFRQSLALGLKYFNKIAKQVKGKTFSGKNAFLLYQSYGFPLEMTQELAEEKGLEVDAKEFEKEQEKHKKLSRIATKGRFKSGLADKSEETTRLHTATHLLLAALRKVLSPNIEQKGSNITSERLRFDFNYDRKMTEKEIKKIEDLVNSKIKAKLPVKKEEMSVEQAKKSGASGVFEHKYKGNVSVYSIGNFSKEICAGPHAPNTKELGKFKIVKEESVGEGIRRIKAVLEKK
jgi:alanyl-tRNA synthetase